MATPDVLLEVPQGRFELHRHPVRAGSQLRAWDAADELVLHHLAEAGAALADRDVLVVGDRAGGLGVPLVAAGARVRAMADSALAHAALRANLAANGLDAPVAEIPATADDLAGPLDLVIVKIPRSLALLEDELRRVRPALGEGTQVVLAGMTKLVRSSTLELVERVLGPPRTSHARKKARLVHVDVDPQLDPGPSPFPTRYTPDAPGLEGTTVVSHAGVFAQGRLDHGTRLLLAHLPDVAPGSDVVDLGCGDGVVGLAIARRQPDCRIAFLDHTHSAVASARATMAANLPDRDGDTYLLGDGMDPLADGSVDLVVVNPPFHDDRAVGDATAWAMFTGARRALRPGGQLVVVGNRHLAHHAKLGRLLGGSRVLGSDRRFVVLSATRRPGRDDAAVEEDRA